MTIFTQLVFNDYIVVLVPSLDMNVIEIFERALILRHIMIIKYRGTCRCCIQFEKCLYGLQNGSKQLQNAF